MLSRLLNSARSIIPFNRSDSQISSEAVAATEAGEMVTTRRQSGNKAALEGGEEPVESFDLPKELLSPASKKRTRAQAADEVKEEKATTPRSASKRQKKLPVRNKEEEPVEDHTHFSAELPIAKLSQDIAKSPSPRRSKSSPKARKPQTQEETVEENSGDVEVSDEAANIPKSTIKSPRSKKAIKISDKSTNKIVTPAKSSAKPKHKRFGSEEPAEPIVVQTAPAPEIEDSAEEDSDDDAPEVVGAQDAEEAVRAAARDAAKATEQQEFIIRHKRKERDTKLKEQAKTASKKRKQADSLSGIHTQSLADSTKDVASDSEKISEVAKIDRANLPSFLPTSFFEEDEEAEAEADTDIVPVRQAKKTKFTDLLEEKKAKDLVRGLTTYRVVENNPHAVLLTPKATGAAKITKDAWLQGRNGRGAGVTGVGGSRKKDGGGFFVNKEKTKSRKRR